MHPPRNPLKLSLQSRDRETSNPASKTLQIQPRNLGIVLVDLWNYHWCKTSSQRVACLVPRINKCLEIARSLGIQIFLCPTDVASNYVGTTQYETPLAAPRCDVPNLPDPEFPKPADGGGCSCGTDEDGRCQVNYGWDAMSPDLIIGDQDLIVDDREILYSLCQSKEITHLIYAGVHTQMCLLGKSIGMLSMLKAGMPCMLARDLTDAHGYYDPDAGVTPDDFTESIVAHFERYLCPSINLADTWDNLGLWPADNPVDPVRITPWGTEERPHLFEDPITVTLTNPWQRESAIHYTTDGSEPTRQSPLYRMPFTVEETTLVRSAAYRGTDIAALPSQGYFARLPPLPPQPDIHLSDLNPKHVSGPGHVYNGDVRWTPGINPPQKDQSNRKLPLRLRGKSYWKGMGVHAPNVMAYAVNSEYQRFVALAGVDESIVDHELGSDLAMYPSVVFRIVIDGRIVAESPVMRIQEQPWRFDVPLPAGSRQIRLIAMDGGNGNREDLANWVDAGFMVG